MTVTISEFVAQRGTIRRGARGDVVKRIQTALNAAGHELVPDGDYGRATEAAVIRYKAAYGYAATGDIGPLTAKYLDKEIAKAPATLPAPLPSVSGVAPWLTINRAITGTKEFDGGKNNPIILGWVSSIIERYPELKPGIGWYKHDSVPWCGLHQAYTMAKAGFRPPLEPLLATNWFYKWEDGVKLSGPALGAVVVMTRQGGGHVTQYEGEDDNYWFGRGGNQSDTVNVAKFPKSRPILGYMWPKGATLPPIGRVRMSFNAAVSVKEG